MIVGCVVACVVGHVVGHIVVVIVGASVDVARRKQTSCCLRTTISADLSSYGSPSRPSGLILWAWKGKSAI